MPGTFKKNISAKASPNNATDRLGRDPMHMKLMETFLQI